MNRCEPNEYACDMHHCIAKSRVCDGTMDCRTGLDEKDCLIAGKVVCLFSSEVLNLFQAGYF